MSPQQAAFVHGVIAGRAGRTATRPTTQATAFRAGLVVGVRLSLIQARRRRAANPAR